MLTFSNAQVESLVDCPAGSTFAKVPAIYRSYAVAGSVNQPALVWIRHDAVWVGFAGSAGTHRENGGAVRECVRDRVEESRAGVLVCPGVDAFRRVEEFCYSA